MTTLVSAETSVPIMSSDEVKRGMKGVGRTVFTGTKIEEFEVEILGVLQNWRLDTDLILGRLSGKPGGAIDRAGLIAGMSGSPIYIDGRLIGAVAYGWTFAKEAICGITPIEKMLGVFGKGLEKRPAQGMGSGERGRGRGGEREMGGGANSRHPLLGFLPKEQANGGEESRDPFANTLLARSGWKGDGVEGVSLSPIATPLVLSGFCTEVVEEMMPELARFGIIPVQGGGAREDEAKRGPFEPGSAVGVQLVRGDLSATGIGTLTYRDGDRVLAFGHPMFFAGAIDLPMTGSTIYDVLPSVARSFKFGSATELLGVIRQDRLPAIAGLMGEPPDMVPVTARIGGAAETVSVRFEVVRDRNIGPFFIYYALANAMMAVEKPSGPATVRGKAHVRIEGYPPLELENVVSGDAAIFQTARMLSIPIATLVQNAFEEVRLEEVAFEITVEETIHAAGIEGVRVDRRILRPGDPLYVTVFLRAHLGERFAVRDTLLIPKDLEDGIVRLRVCDAQSSETLEVKRAPGKYIPHSVEQLIGTLNYEERNDHLIVELIAPQKGVTVEGAEMPSLPPSALEILRSSRQTRASLPVEGVVRIRKRIQTNFVISGRHTIELKIDRNAR
ncbi:MAG: hypothetical protein DRP97_04280 [Candidatus Latescibacterota bacterium]|nr:MAG: hypothetical protein DRP97_04280 [Candidatus Latescibacterota bacterium]